jgi:hypothetical protein
MGAEPWPDQKSVQITGAISFERDLFVTAFFSRECWLSKVSGYRGISASGFPDSHAHLPAHRWLGDLYRVRWATPCNRQLAFSARRSYHIPAVRSNKYRTMQCCLFARSLFARVAGSGSRHF